MKWVSPNFRLNSSWSLNLPSLWQPGCGRRSRPWAGGAAGGRRWRDTARRRCCWGNGGATGPSTWCRDPPARSCSIPATVAGSRGESRARCRRCTARLSWSLRCPPLRGATRWCNAHRKERIETQGTQSLRQQEERRQKKALSITVIKTAWKLWKPRN